MANPKTRIVTWTWDDSQFFETQWPANGTEVARKRPTGGQQVGPYNKDKKDKKEKTHGE